MEGLGIDPVRLLWQTINFLILLWILNRVLFKPVLRMMDQRAHKVRESVDEAERMRTLAAEIRQENNDLIERAKKEANDLINAATHAANQIQDKSRQDAQEEAERLLVRARDEIQLERNRAIADVRQQAVDLAILAAGKVIEQHLEPTQHYQLVKTFLDDVQLDAKDGKN